ncbi:tetratricopeptide repeat protein [Acidovorax sp. NCPPB 3576]|uniref:tetratricopeptide repeat protein n=1 Tax=Acidovorax sp. NCPPB 3576 TaxID=2940488 RepID=UPI002349AF74|nr:tetratricopeptide repeat protein [Acidovorax sp. NCPPB 3576]WCM87263.1 tetratricopeptide repeat protein [Acidovorax sp. NCPPB 3576]
MDYYESMAQSHRLWTVALACALVTGTLSAQAQNLPAPAPQSGLRASQESSSDAAAALDAELFYEILLGEISTTGGDPGTGYSLMLEAARRSGDSQLYRRAIEIALQSRSAEYALAAARAWKSAQPQSREANRYVLQILIALNRIEETSDLLKQELAQSPASDKAMTLQAIPQLYGRATDKTVAVKVVEQALSDQLINPASGPTAWITIGRMRLAAGDKKGGLDAARQAQTLEAPADGVALLALQLLEAGEPEAEPLVARYLAGAPKPEIRMAYVRTLLDSQRYAEAAKQADLLTQSTPDMAEAWLIKASLHLQANRLDEAHASLLEFQKLLEALPAGDSRRSAMAQAFLMQAQIAEKRGNLAEAEAWLARVENSAELLTVQSRRASLLARQGKLPEAIALIRAVPAKTPQEERMKLLAEVQLLRDAQKYREAYETQAKAAALAPQDNELVYDQAMLAEKAGLLDEMEKLLREIIARQPDYHHAYNALGYSFAERDIRLPEAKQLIAKALQYAPGDPFIMDSLGWVEFRLGNRKEAARLLGDAFKAQPDPEIAAHLGEVLWSLGERDRATSVWKEGLRLNKDNDTLRQTLKRLGANP